MSEEKSLQSVGKGLFYGEVDENSIFPFPKLDADQKEMGRELVRAVQAFCEGQVDSEKLDHDSQIPDDVFQGVSELGLCGMAVEEQHGGLELDYSLYARVFSEISAYDGSLAVMLGAHQSIGYKALLAFGSDEQKAKWLPKLASGEVYASFCLTEPGSGSDAYSIKTKAVDNGNGTYTINGQKLWITNAGKAGFYSVFAKTDHEIDGKNVEKISCFIVEKGMEGVSFGEKEKKMGIKASETRAVYFDKVVVPKENIIGELGKGFKIAMNVLNTGRLSLGSGCVGGMRAIYKMATEHAKTRHQFDRSISEFGIIQDKIARMAADIYASESMVYFTTGKMNQGMDDFSVESAICKIFCSESLWRTVDQSMQIAGGIGYMNEYPYERMMRDARINLIFEGTNEILRVFVALAGIKGPSDDLKELGKVTDMNKVLNDPIKSVGVLGNFARKRIGRMISTKSLTKVHEELEDLASDFSSMLNDFSTHVENVLIKYGKNIIGNELPQKRIADMAIGLYSTICVLSRTTSILEDSSISDEDKEFVVGLTEIVCKDAKDSFKKASKEAKRKSDRKIKKVSDMVIERGGYNLDIVEF